MPPVRVRKLKCSNLSLFLKLMMIVPAKLPNKQKKVFMMITWDYVADTVLEELTSESLVSLMGEELRKGRVKNNTRVPNPDIYL